MLLRIRVANYRSIREPTEISLVSSSLKTVVPEDGDWLKSSVRVAGIYGANGAGKSTLLLAIDFVAKAVRHSATTWAESNHFPYDPFLLDHTSALEPSEFSLDVIIEGIRYEYGFTANSQAVISEWLYSYPLNRRRKLFERSAKNEVELAEDPSLLAHFSFSRELSGDNISAAKTVQPHILFLSAAANTRHKFLSPIAHRISRHIKFARYGDWDKEARLKMIKAGFEKNQAAMTAATAILIKSADIGISTVCTQKSEMPPDVIKHLKEVEADESRSERAKSAVKEMLEDMHNKLVFGHVGEGHELFDLPEDQESSGTLAWLSLVIPARNSFRFGDTLLIDELDASLHPHLAAALIALFKNTDLNSKGAQLIFTTHDTNLLTDSVGDPLEPDEVWFAEKNHIGVTEIFGLADFQTRKTDNFARRYLSGRYGAVPVVDVKALRALTETGDNDESPKELTRHQAQKAESAREKAASSC